MRVEKFRTLLEELRYSYGLPMYSGEEGNKIFAFLYEHIGRKISSQTVEDFKRRFFVRNDRFPSKVLDALEAAYDDVLRRTQSSECYINACSPKPPCINPYCDPNQYFRFYLRRKDGKLEHRDVTCGECGKKGMTREQVVEKGGLLITKELDEEYWQQERDERSKYFPDKGFDKS
jgi:hypothetical protein